MKSNKKLNFLFYSLIITLIFFIPFYFHTIHTVDLNYHLSRIQGIRDGIFSHNFPVYIYPYTNFEYGYASPMFYCDLFYLIPAFLYAIGVPLLISYKIFIFVVSLVGTFLSLTAFDKMFNNNRITLISCIIYSFSSIRILDIGTRSGGGSILAYAFMPLVILSLHNFFILKQNNYIMIGISFSLLLLSHIISFVLVCVLFFILLLANIKNTTYKQYLTIIKGASIAILLSAFFLFPFLEQLISQKFWFQFTTSINGPEFISYSQLSIKEIFQDFFIDTSIYKYIVGSLTILFYSVLFFVCLLKKRIKSKNIFLFFLFLFILLITSNIIPTDKIPFLYSIQFIWRLNFIAFFIALYEICDLLQKINISSLDRICVILTFVFFSFNTSTKYISLGFDENIPLSSSYDDLVYLNIEWIKGTHNFNGFEIVGGEYLPYTNSYNYYESNKNIVFPNEDTYSFDYYRNGTTIIFDSDYNYKEKVFMPLSYYKGYYYQEIDSDGSIIFTRECFPNEYSKRVGIEIDKGTHTYKVFYKGTLIQKTSLFLSLLSLMLILLKINKGTYIILPKHKRIQKK